MSGTPLTPPVTRSSPVYHDDLLQCPTVYTRGSTGGIELAQNGQSYGYNAWGVGRTSLAPNSSLGLSQWPADPAVAESAVKVPADMIAFGDAFQESGEYAP